MIRKTYKTTILISLLALSAVGCGDDDEGTPTKDGGMDATTADATINDAKVIDPDAVVRDAQVVDPDAVVPDARILDARVRDAVVLDAVVRDAVVLDARVLDARIDDASIGFPGDFTLVLEEFDPHIGQDIYVTVVNENGDMAVGSAKVNLAAGTQKITIPGIIMANNTYVVNLFADVNGNGGCQFNIDGSEDHVWTIINQKPQGDILYVRFRHDTAWEDVCNDIENNP